MGQALAEQPETPAGSSNEGLAEFLLIDDPPERRGLAWFAINPVLAKHTLRVALPVVLGMVTQTAVNILDGLMVGRLPKEIAIPGQAAIGMTLPGMWLIGGFLSAIWVGTQAITSRRAGEGNDEGAGRALANSLLLAVGSSLLLSWIAILIVPRFASLLHQDANVVQLGTDYLQIRLVGIVAMVTTFSLKSFFDGIVAPTSS